MKSLSVICVSTKNNNIFTDLISDDDSEKSFYDDFGIDVSSVKKLDFTHALINNCVDKYKLEIKTKIPEFNQVKDSWMLSHVYWRHDEPEEDGFQNIKATVELLLKAMRCAYEQKLDIKHCQSVEVLVPESNKEGKTKARLISLIVKKKEDGKYEENTKAIMTYCEKK